MPALGFGAGEIGHDIFESENAVAANGGWPPLGFWQLK